MRVLRDPSSPGAAPAESGQHLALDLAAGADDERIGRGIAAVAADRQHAKHGMLGCSHSPDHPPMHRLLVASEPVPGAGVSRSFDGRSEIVKDLVGCSPGLDGRKR